jgi:hypothetical protein
MANIVPNVANALAPVPPMKALLALTGVLSYRFYNFLLIGSFILSTSSSFCTF